MGKARNGLDTARHFPEDSSGWDGLCEFDQRLATKTAKIGAHVHMLCGRCYGTLRLAAKLKEEDAKSMQEFHA